MNNPITIFFSFLTLALLSLTSFAQDFQLAIHGFLAIPGRARGRSGAPQTLASTVFVEIGLLGKKEAISAKLSRVLLFFILGSRRFSISSYRPC
jgi:hypothetical protein